jgi:PAS domain S-box-containing protein
MGDSSESGANPAADDRPTETVLREFAPAPYHALDAEGTVTAVNDAWLEAVPAERGDVVGGPFDALLTDASVERFRSVFPDWKTAGHASDVEFELVGPDGATVWVDLDASVECDDGGAVRRIHCQIRDVTEQKSYEAFVNNSTDVILLHDESGKAKYVSPAITREFGYEPEELVGELPFEDIHPEDRERAMDAFSQMVTNPETVVMEEYRIQRADGSWAWTESRGRSLLGEDEIGGVLINSRVISERKAYEQEIERQNERLEAFANVVSHDLRNPLQVANARLELAQEACETDHLDEVAEAHDRMHQLIDDLLTLARDGRQVTEVEPVDLAAEIERYRSVTTEEATIQVKTNQRVLADPGRLRRLIENLVRNAIEHTPGEVTITLGSLDDGFYLADDGPGIAPEDREAVFETGYSEAEDGTGFGLNIVSQIAEAHGWEVTLTESEAEGARFEVTGVTTLDE